MKLQFLACLLTICAFFIVSHSQTQVKHQSNTSTAEKSPPKFFPLSDLREGMTGTAQTVFRGSTPEKFNVEILGVVPGAIGPKQDMIIGKISGGQADRTHVFAGMSGSPVYIDGKLVGAIAYSFPFSKEAICGITPIRQMISMFEKNRATTPKKKTPREISFAELSAANWQPNFPNEAKLSNFSLANGYENSSLRALAGQTFRPIATPVTFSGFSNATLDAFRQQLLAVGLLPVSSLGGSSGITPLKKIDQNTLRGGASVVMQLTRGDYSLSAAGTVTLRNGRKIYAFGHPFLSLGSSDLPMSESSVVIVVPSVNNSFKLAVPTGMVGRMTQDRATGVYGKLGTAPKMIPVRLNLRTSRNHQKTFRFEVARDDALTPLLVNIGIYNSIIANERTMGNLTISLKGKIEVKGHKSLDLEHRFTGSRASQTISQAVAAPVMVLRNSGFEDLEIGKISLDLIVTDGTKLATLEQIGIDKSEVKAGETFEVNAYVRSKSGRLFLRKVPVSIPADTPSGKVLVTVGDGNSLQMTSNIRKFVPKSLADLIATINRFKKNDRLYVQTHRVTKGIIIGTKEMPNLPPSVLATIGTARTTSGFKPTVQTLLTEAEIPPADFIIIGRKTLTIKVVR